MLPNWRLDMKNYSVKNSPLLITVINVVLAQIAHTASNLKISQPPLSNVIAANCSALNVKMMTTLQLRAKKSKNGWIWFWRRKLMQNGLQLIPSYVQVVGKQLKGQLVATIWNAFVGKVFAICAASHGSLTIKIISNVIFLRKRRMELWTDRKRC